MAVRVDKARYGVHAESSDWRVHRTNPTKAYPASGVQWGYCLHLASWGFSVCPQQNFLEGDARLGLYSHNKEASRRRVR